MADKDFDSWNQKKKVIHASEVQEFVHEREVWWCLIGVNIGDEEDAKNKQFGRPVLVIKKFNRNLVLVVPLITKLKDNNYYFSFTHDSTQFAAILSQLRIISTKRFTRRIKKINQPVFDELKKKIIKVCF